MSTNPYDRLAETGDAAWAAATPRNANPHPQGSALRETWFTTWDAAALEGAGILKGNAAGALYKACLTAASLLRDMRNNPRTLTTRSGRYREVEVEVSTALSKAQAASVAPSAPSGRLAERESEGANQSEAN